MFVKKSRKKAITSFDKVTLSISGMRYSIDYEIIRRDAEAEVTLYGVRYITGGGRERTPEKTERVPAGKIVELLNECDVMKWDAFHGKHPKKVFDGEMFSFAATVNDGEGIRADGSENFPKNYRKFKDMIRVILESGNHTENGREDK